MWVRKTEWVLRMIPSIVYMVKRACKWEQKSKSKRSHEVKKKAGEVYPDEIAACVIDEEA